MEKCCEDNNVHFKNLLLVGNAPGHPPLVGDLAPNVTVVFLLPNTTSDQPGGQGVRVWEL